ncbi:transglutaminase domain-containing protein [Segetibacter aerophilus]|uniref:Transglutaminase-like domain-containing protein n=1 Tax=Segetibacter aerophilus TaxID=670293 RepID=A0A512BE43_9BACT|nr:transglutaminase domain-containing protein [Segetibacter aerophilus]GEO10231.1 hypothetical protein SAE01_27270 [Segetibacter aerophilus]
MKRVFITVAILILFASNSHAQFSAQDKMALEIPQPDTYSTNGISSYVKSHFSSDSERVRALFVWVANNVNYDVEKVRTRNLTERTTVAQVLQTRMAICQGYSELLVALLKECNIKSMLVGGYTKEPNGSISELSHAWVAAEVNNKWYFFDPTWAAGSVKDYRFSRSFSNRYYKLLPEQMIKDHMPFDPMNQLLNYPVTYDEFNNSNVSINTTKPFFNYADTLIHHNSLDSLNQFAGITRRINKNGEKNRLVYDMVQLLNKNQSYGESKLGFEGAVSAFNTGTALFNRYIDYKNSRFNGIKSNKEIQQMIDSVLLYIKSAYTMLQPVVADTDDNKRALEGINGALLRFYNRVEEENIFLKRYLQTSRTTR